MIETIFNNLFSLTDFFLIQFISIALAVVIIFSLLYIIDS